MITDVAPQNQTCKVTIALPGLNQHTIPLTTSSTVELVRYTFSHGANTWYALLVDGRHYHLVMAKFTVGRPHLLEALNTALHQAQEAIAMLKALPQ